MAMAPPLTLIFEVSHFPIDRDRLRGERLVNFHQIEFLMRPACLPETQLARLDWTHTHDLRIDTCRGIGFDPGQRLQSQFIGLAPRHHHDRGGAIIEPRGISGGYRAVLTEGGLELAKGLYRGAWTNILVRVKEGAALLAQDFY